VSSALVERVDGLGVARFFHIQFRKFRANLPSIW
jgi:hypothetical protein